MKSLNSGYLIHTFLEKSKDDHSLAQRTEHDGMSQSTIHRHLRNTLLRHSPSLAVVSEWIPYLPLDSRKLILTVAQTGLDDEDGRIRSAAIRIAQQGLTGVDGETLGRRLLFEIIRETSRSPFNRSLVMMLVRCESSLIDDGSDEAVVGGITKEIQASQNIFSDGQTLNYSTLFGDGSQQWSIEAPITPAWRKNASWLANSLSRQMAKLRNRVLFPSVQRKKNMSQESCNNLWEAGYRHPSLEVNELRTVDLEIHRFRTGQIVQGDLEMRWAWKYNDLKPRVYYCVGATPYWTARYMRLITSTLMDCWPMTHFALRKNPDNLTWFLDDSDYVTMWDYESFTTTLSELKFFLYWMTRYLENDLFVRQNPLRLFDWSEGIIEANIWEILDAYNQEINVFSRYSIHRVIDRIGFGPDLSSMAQHNSGALGVLGNIGLSTLLHGIHIGPITKNRQKGVSVGDDAFAMQSRDPAEQLIPHIQRLGRIHPEKFEILRPIQSEIEFQVWKFLKRRITRDVNGIHLDVLYDFPIFANVFAVASKNRTIRKGEMEETVHKFVGQVSSLFWSIFRRGYDFSDSDIVLLREILFTCYKTLKLRFKGSLAGIPHHGGFTMALSVPPILDFDPRLDDWAEVLWENATEKYILLPLDSTVFLPPAEFQFVGQEFEATTSQILTIMEDLGIVSKDGPLKGYVDVCYENRWLYRKAVENSFTDIYRYKFICDPPLYYNSAVRDIAGTVRIDTELATSSHTNVWSETVTL